MTTPRTPPEVAPAYSVDTLDLPGRGRVDELGREWELTAEKGWDSGAPPRTQRAARGNGHGSTRARSTTDEISCSISGTVHFDDPELMERTKIELRALCRDGGRLYPLRRVAGAFDQVRHVELDAAPEIAVVGHYDIDFQFTFAAPDPRAHATVWQERLFTAPANIGLGLDFSGAGVDTSGAGMDFGTPDPPTVAELANYGTAEAFPFLRIPGPAQRPVISAQVAGWSFTFQDYVDEGDALLINLDDHPARGVPGRTVLSEQRGNVRVLCTALPDSPAVAPQAVERISLQAAASGASGLACLRSAWW